MLLRTNIQIHRPINKYRPCNVDKAYKIFTRYQSKKLPKLQNTYGPGCSPIPEASYIFIVQLLIKANKQTHDKLTIQNMKIHKFRPCIQEERAYFLQIAK